MLPLVAFRIRPTGSAGLTTNALGTPEVMVGVRAVIAVPVTKVLFAGE